MHLCEGWRLVARQCHSVQECTLIQAAKLEGSLKSPASSTSASVCMRLQCVRACACVRVRACACVCVCVRALVGIIVAKACTSMGSMLSPYQMALD